MTNSEVQFGELNLDFRFGKNSEVLGFKTKNKNKLKCKIESLEVLGHWGWIPRATEGFQGPFLALGRMTYSHLPNRVFI